MQAVATYDAALARDPTLFSAASNRGVLLAQQGQLEEAIRSFRNAVAINPEFATGWANLGRALMMAHPVASFVEAQGALGRAGTLQHQLRGTQPDLQIDESVYDTGLDLSRPLPPNWRFSETATPPITALTAVAILVVLVRLICALLLDQGGDRAGPAPGPITRAAARQLGIDFQARAPCLRITITAVLFALGISNNLQTPYIYDLTFWPRARRS